MALLRQFLREHAILSPDQDWRHADIAGALQGVTVTPLAAGLQARVFKLEDHPWVMKEGRWDLEIELFEGMKLPLDAQRTERVLSNFSFTFLPTEDQIRRQAAQYLLCQRYYGMLKPDADDHHILAGLAAEQRTLRDGLSKDMSALTAAYRLRRYEKALQALLEHQAVRHHHFLPEEHLLVGDSLSPENEGKRTSFIFQEFIDGKPLHDVNLLDEPVERRREMAMWLLLTLAMHHREHMLPDTRPRYPLAQSYDWLTKTDNIFVARDGIRFIDTRWFWETDRNIVKRGGLIPDLTLRGVRATLISLLGTLA